MAEQNNLPEAKSIGLNDEMNTEYASPGHISVIVITPNDGT